ncbi:MAG: prepilin-type N-terminal cleavage/methylation domain-containing protein [Oscillospiraceae bacterium]|nr:prepilin-type N-terminal cleavage/methylation domain-containing protein [Candidatus Limimonas egerieequi]
MFNLRNNKLGMTLIEMVISLVVLGILTTSTMGIIISSNNIFISTSNAALDRQVGGHVFETLTSILKYSTHLSIYDADKAPAEGVAQSVSLNLTDDTTQSGILMFKHKDQEDATKLYNDSFYGRRTVQYTLEEAGSSHKHIKLTVRVFRDGKQRYELSRIIKCVNLALISTGVDANFIKDMSTPGTTNQFISFSVDEQLISGGKDAFSLEYKISEYMAKYNRIQLEYTSKLQAVYGEVNAKIGNTENKEGKRVAEAIYEQVVNMRKMAVLGIEGSNISKWEGEDVYQYQNLRQHYQDEIKDLLKFTPTAGITKSTATNPFYGVVATKEELYTGFLLTYYDTNKDGKVSKDEYPQFTDPKTFFQGTSIANYVSNTTNRNDANQMVIMSYFRENTNENYDDLYSVKEKVVHTFSGNFEKGYSHSIWYSTNDGPGYDKGEILHDTNFTSLEETRPVAGSMNADCHGANPDNVQTYFTITGASHDSGNDFYHIKYDASTNIGGLPYYEYKGFGATYNRNGNVKGSDVINTLKNTYGSLITQMVPGTNCQVYYSSADNGTVYIYPTTDLAQGWYYLIYNNSSLNWTDYSQRQNGIKYMFFYLSAAQSEASKAANTGNIAVKGNAFASISGSASKAYGRIVLGGVNVPEYFGSSDCSRFTGWAYAQAQYADMETGANSAENALFDSVVAHQYTDYVLYGVDWNSWFKSSPDGLLNKIMTGVINIVGSIFGRDVNKNITYISGDNAIQSLGNRGKYTTSNFDGDIASYNLAWTIYSPKRGTWYYLPSGSTRLSNLTSQISLSSNKDQPIPLDVDLKTGNTWTSSTAMVSDIDSRKLSSSGLFGLVDTTKDVLWVGLPTGNQVSVNFETPTIN